MRNNIILSLFFLMTGFTKVYSSPNLMEWSGGTVFVAASLTNGYNEVVEQNKKINGPVWQGLAGIKYERPCDIYALFRGDWGGGKLNRNEFINPWFLEGRIGYDFGFFCYRASITPYTGIIYREFDKRFTTLLGVREHLRLKEWVVPLGFVLNYQMTTCFRVGIDFQAGFHAHQRENFIVNNQSANAKFAVFWNLETPFTWLINRSFSLAFIPTYFHDRYLPVSNAPPLVDSKQYFSFAGGRLEFAARF